MKIPTLSPEMVDAYDFAKANGGHLIRHAGGFWGSEHGRASRTFGTTTAQALVRRGVADYTEWKESWGRKFPIRLTIKPLSP